MNEIVKIFELLARQSRNLQEELEYLVNIKLITKQEAKTKMRFFVLSTVRRLLEKGVEEWLSEDENIF